MKTRPSAGFTLVELIVVMAIMGIAMTIAVPGTRDFLSNQRMRTASFNLVASAMFARSEAVKRGIPVFIKAPASNDLNGGWCVLVSAAATCSMTAPGNETMRVQQPLSGVDYAFDTTAGVIAFNRAGRLASAVRIEIVDAETGGMARCVRIDVGGSARSDLGDCS